MEVGREKNTLSRDEKIEKILEDARKEAAYRTLGIRRENEVNELATQDRSVTSQNVSYLGELLSDLSNRLDILESKLNPVLTDSPESESMGPSTSYAGNTVLSEMLATYCRITNGLVERVTVLTDRIDV